MKILRYALLCALAVTVTLPAIAEDEKELGWASTAEFGYVTTSGNSDVETLSFGSETIRSWETSSLSFKLAAIRSEQSTRRGIAVGLPILIDHRDEFPFPHLLKQPFRDPFVALKRWMNVIDWNVRNWWNASVHC